MMSTLSVIIPVHNTEKPLGSCIDSLVNQTYAKLQIILVNCGGESCTALCDSLAAKDSRICVVNADSSCDAAAKNAGLDAATGDYIVFAQADSIFDSAAAEKCMAEIAAHSPDLLVCAIETEGEEHRRIFIDGNMYTRYEYTETIARYISTGLGFDTIANKVFSAQIINSRSLRFDVTKPLVADQLFNCRYFTASGHIRCVSLLLYSTKPSALNGTTEYLAQAKEYSQKLIDAVQSKGLYSIASREIGENYQKLLYRHLMLIAAQSDDDNAQRFAALEAVSSSADNVPLSMYLDSLPGVKNKAASHLYKLRQWKMLLALLKE